MIEHSQQQQMRKGQDLQSFHRINLNSKSTNRTHDYGYGANSATQGRGDPTNKSDMTVPLASATIQQFYSKAKSQIRPLNETYTDIQNKPTLMERLEMES